MTVPLVTIVGRPNVGKSTLFNRLCGGHAALVEDEPGVTRDRRYGEAEWTGRRFRVVDTGGLDPAALRGGRSVARSMAEQALRAVDEAALCLFLFDARSGIVPGDRDALELLRRRGKRILWVANKVDSARQEDLAAELYELGADRVIAVSATHGRNVGELADAILEALPDAPPLAEEARERPLRVALVGRPNAGKSSLFNRLVGSERVIVDATPGTTRDPVDTMIEVAGERFLLIDTAGIRRRARVERPMEKIAVAMAERSIARADVAVLVVDAKGGVAEQEAKIAGLCEEHGAGLVIAFNKRDLIEAKDERRLKEALERQLQFVPWAEVVYCSAKTGRGVHALVDRVAKVGENLGRRAPTGQLNRLFEKMLAAHPPPIFRGRPVRLYYITQAESRPPTFVLSVNYPEGIHFSYRRYLVNRLREEFDFRGAPVRLICKRRR